MAFDAGATSAKCPSSAAGLLQAESDGGRDWHFARASRTFFLETGFALHINVTLYRFIFTLHPHITERWHLLQEEEVVVVAPLAAVVDLVTVVVVEVEEVSKSLCSSQARRTCSCEIATKTKTWLLTCHAGGFGGGDRGGRGGFGARGGGRGRGGDRGGRGGRGGARGGARGGFGGAKGGAKVIIVR